MSTKAQEGKELGLFSDTITGTTFDRINLEALYELCEKNPGHVDYIFVQRWDRFGRDTGEAFRTIRRFVDVGIEINCPEQWVDFKEPMWPHFLGFYITSAHSESLKISERTRKGIHQANMSGYYTASAPPGYTRMTISDGGKSRRLLTPDHKALHVKRAFELVAEGVPRSEVYKQIGKYIGRAKSRFYDMLKNPVYIGLVPVKAYKSHPAMIVDGKHEALVSLDVWESVQKVLEENSGTTKNMRWSNNSQLVDDFFLKKVLRGLDGDPVRAYWSKGKTKRYAYYEARSSKLLLSAQKSHDAVSEAIESIIIDPALTDVLGKNLKLLVDPIKSEISTLQDGIKRRNRKLKKIEDDYTDDLITAASFSTMQTRIRSELAEITKDLKKKEAEYNLFPSFDELCEHLDLGKIYNATDCKSKAYLLQAIFPKGFTILKPEYKLRTPFANPFVSITNSVLLVLWAVIHFGAVIPQMKIVMIKNWRTIFIKNGTVRL